MVIKRVEYSSSKFSAAVFQILSVFCSLKLINTSISVEFLWVPSLPGHVGIIGDELTDQLASSTNNSMFYNPPYCPNSDFIQYSLIAKIHPPTMGSAVG